MGGSVLVGNPVAVLLLAEHATVAVCHSRTRNRPTSAAGQSAWCRRRAPSRAAGEERQNSRRRTSAGRGRAGRPAGTILKGAGSYVVGEETVLLACIEGVPGTVSAQPALPGGARPAWDADGRQQRRTLANITSSL